MKQQISALFEYTVLNFVFRGVRDGEGYHRMEKKRVDAKQFKRFMQTGKDPKGLEWYNTDDYRNTVAKILKTR